MRVTREFRRSKPGTYCSDSVEVTLTPEDLGLTLTPENFQAVFNRLAWETWYQGNVDLVKSGHQTVDEAKVIVDHYRKHTKEEERGTRD